MIHDRHKDWLEARGIDAILAEKLGIETTRDDGGNWLTVPYVERGVVVNHKYRTISDKRHRMDADADLIWWNHDVLLRPEVQAGGVVVITEGEWDALAAMQSGFSQVLSVPNGAPASETDQPYEAKRYRFVHRSIDLTDKVGTFILATDADGPGRALAADLARLLGPERCRFVVYPDGCKDLNDVLLHDPVGGVGRIIEAAKPYPIKGLYRLADFPEPPPVQSLEIGMEGVDPHFRLVPGTLTVITGYAGQGKTSWMLAVLAKLLKRGVSMAVASFETMPRPILERRLRAALYEVGEYHSQSLRPGDADALMHDRLSVIAQTVDDEDDEMTLEYLLDLAKMAVIRDGIRLLVIDPWNEIEHKRKSDESETDYIGRALRALKRFARLYDCAVWLVAHPKKPQADGSPKAPSLYDLAGSANFANKADYGIIVHRKSPMDTQVNIRISKVRMGLPGYAGDVLLEWHGETSSYSWKRQFV